MAGRGEDSCLFEEDEEDEYAGIARAEQCTQGRDVCFIGTGHRQGKK